MMTKEEINTALTELAKEVMSTQVIAKGKKILEDYQIAVTHSQHQLKEEFIANGGNEKDFKLERDAQDATFDALWADFSKLKKEYRTRLANAERENLGLKEAIIAKINDLKSEEHIKHAHETFKGLETQWKSIGKVPQDKLKDLDTAYSKARDEFFYNMGIYRELLENDLKKNLELKEQIVSKMKSTLELTSFKDMDATARRLTDEWNEIGPTYKEKWEGIRDEFWTAHHAIFDKIKDFYKSQKEKQQENLKKKKELIAKIEEINTYAITTDKSWKKHTKIVVDLQKEWRSIGYTPKAENEKIWGEFKANADTFFSKKSAYYLALKEVYDKNKEVKEGLLKRAEEISKSHDFKSTANQLTKLQKQWRETGPAHHRDEQRLWKKFRAACNAFFDLKKTRQKQDTIEQRENLSKKNAILDKIKLLPKSSEPAQNMKQIDELIKEYNAVGFVPLGEKQKISVDFKNLIHKKLSESGIPETEVTEYLFNVKIKELSTSQNPEQALEKEAQHIREKIRGVKATILQYENNLGFFKHSKGANALKDEVEEKIEANKVVLSKLESKLSMIYNSYK